VYQFHQTDATSDVHMISVRQLLDFIKANPLVIEVLLKDEETAITGVAPNSEAGPNDMAWISARNLNRNPNCLRQFAGAVLLVPEAAVLDAPPLFTVLKTRNAKLLFTQIVDRFFDALIRTDLPALGENPIASDAVIGEHVRLGHGCVIGPRVVLGAGVTIGANTVIANCRVAPLVTIGNNCTIGMPGFGYEKDDDGTYWRFPHLGGVLIESGVEIGSNTCVDRGSLGDTVIGRGCKIDNLVHIAHNVVLGANTIVIANAMLGGSVHTGDGVWIAPSVTIMNQTRIGSGATLGLGSVVLKEVMDNQTIVGNPGKMLERKA